MFFNKWLPKRPLHTERLKIERKCINCGFLGLPPWRFLTQEELDKLTKEASSDLEKRLELEKHFRDFDLVGTNARGFILNNNREWTNQPYRCHRRLMEQASRQSEELVGLPSQPGIRTIFTQKGRIRFIKQENKCSGFILYEPGFNPEQHLDLIREKKNNERISKITWRTTIITVVAVIVSGVLGAIIDDLINDSSPSATNEIEAPATPNNLESENPTITP